MSDKKLVYEVLCRFESIGDERLKSELAALKEAISEGRLRHAAREVVPKLYEKRKKLVRQDFLAMIRDVLPETKFQELEDMILRGAGRAAVYELQQWSQGRWNPGDREMEVIEAFFDYYGG
jgi:hypothetical protein